MSISCRNALDYEPRERQPTDIPENVGEEALERAFGFCSELIELLDEQIGPDLAERGETALSEADRLQG
jgi:hypothetical protein